MSAGPARAARENQPAGGAAGPPAAAAGEEIAACDACLRRAWLVGTLGPHLARSHHRWDQLQEMLALSDQDLVAALAGRRRGQVEASYRAFSAASARAAVATAGLGAVCRHDPRFPATLRELPGAPTILHVAGTLARLVELTTTPAVAVVGARRASVYGMSFARVLARELSAAGVPVVSGMALGVDACAHEGALERGGRTLAVLAGGADLPYPRRHRGLYERLAAEACVIAELPPGCSTWRWGFPARNRIIAGLGAITIVVEARERSGALITAAFARSYGRDVAAVPGQVTSALARGPNDLIADGALPVRDVQDVLDAIYGAGARSARPAVRSGDGLPEPLRAALDAVERGHATAGAIAADTGLEDPLAAVAELELLGYLRRSPGGRYERLP